MTLRERIEDNIVKRTNRKSISYFENYRMTNYSLLIMLIFDFILIMYSLVVSNVAVVMFFSVVALVAEAILYLLLVPRFNMANRSMNYFIYGPVFGINILILFICMVVNFQLFEIMMFVARSLIFGLMLCRFSFKRLSYIALTCNIIFACSFTIFLFGNETLSGIQRFSRRVRYGYAPDGTYQVISVDKGSSDKVVIANTYLGKKVTGVAANAFRNASDVREFIFPENLIKLRDDAIKSCNKPVKVISESPQLDFGNFFKNCDTVTRLEYTNGVIENYNFDFLEDTDFPIAMPVDDVIQNKGLPINKRIEPITKKNQYYVNFYDRISLIYSMVVEQDTKLEIPAFLNENENKDNSFFGWYEDEGMTHKLQEDKYVNENIRIYGDFKRAYTIYYHRAGDDFADIEQKFHADDGLIFLHDVDERGYTFHGWYQDINYKNKKDVFDASIAQDVHVYSYYTIIDYIISYEDPYDSILGPVTNNNPTSYNVKSEITLEPLQRNGYRFNGWLNKADNKPVTTIVNSIDNIVLRASWTLETYNVSYYSRYNGTTINSTYNTEVGDLTHVGMYTPPARDHYNFNGWVKEGDTSQTLITSLVGRYGDLQLEGLWTPIEYNITYNNVNYISGNLTPTHYNYTQTITLPVITRTGYNFIGWYEEQLVEDLPPTTAPITTIPAKSFGNKVFYAGWSAIDYTITYVSRATWTYYPGHPVEIGQEVPTLTFPTTFTIKGPDVALPGIDSVDSANWPAGYEFLGWYKREQLDNRGWPLPGTTSDNIIPAGTHTNQTVYASWKCVDPTRQHFIKYEAPPSTHQYADEILTNNWSAIETALQKYTSYYDDFWLDFKEVSAALVKDPVIQSFGRTVTEVNFYHGRWDDPAMSDHQSSTLNIIPPDTISPDFDPKAKYVIDDGKIKSLFTVTFKYAK